MRLHCIPIYPVRCLNYGMRCVWLIEIRTVIPRTFTVWRSCVNNSIIYCTQKRSVLRRRECCTNSFTRFAVKGRRIVILTCICSACRLIPIASVRCSYYGVRGLRFIKLLSIEKSQSRFFTICANFFSCNLTSGNLRSR